MFLIRVYFKRINESFSFTKVSSLDTGIGSMPNIPELKQWNYDTSTSIQHDFKINTMDPMHRSMKLNVEQIHYIMPQLEKVQNMISTNYF